MKKTFITLTIAVGTFAFGQVGVNTTQPKSTLDVMGVSSPTVPDGVLVPRYSVTELAAKDAAYGTDQNGTMVFVTTGTGTSGKTSNIAGAGFYYYDNPTSKWKGIAGNTTPISSFVVTDEIVTDYMVKPTDDYLTLNITAGGHTLTLPTSPDVPIGKIIYASNVGNKNITISPMLRNPSVTQVGALNSGTFIYLGNGIWDVVTGF
ncbi:hypothetical protein D1631_03520 [Chryseobacterium nematophagum]|uniref:Uncharacterized protein n=1 Tax=Chryseobacterium nematophagum TaxID=2305228 RepID=A0A3M7TDJ4_9FLAO|nr:hypothetical protein [Chryseobacterium nematophagum]RNA61066.1 hypothetical protein D1631_03520 [Chryseobacterium nematophagum]